MAAVTGADASRTLGQASAAAPWNVVVILTDDERYDMLPSMPNVRRLLAARGVTFTEFHVTTSECCPSRATILTGQYSHHHHVVGNFGQTGYPRFDERSTLATWLHDAGYRTALVGKYLNAYTVYGDHHVPPGWDRWVTIDSIPEEAYYDYDLNVDGTLVHHGSAPSDYSTDVLAGKARAFLRAQVPGRPFFLYFAPIAPHLPATPAPRDRGALRDLPPLRTPSFDEKDISDKPWRRYHARRLSVGAMDFEQDNVRRRMLESLRAVDRAVAGLVSTLHRRKLLDRTVIFFLSDNGFLLGEHRLGGKIWPYEESTHVPLVVRVPWPEGRGTSNDHLVLNIDLASTIAGLARAVPGRPQDGYDFGAFLRGRQRAWRVDFLEEYRGDSLMHLRGPPRFEAVRDRRFLYVEWDRGWRELYDHFVDPYELHNVAGDPRYAAVQERLGRRIAALAAKPGHRAG